MCNFQDYIVNRFLLFIMTFVIGYSDTNSITLSNSDTIQNGSTVVSTEDSTVINCVISNTSYSIEWFYTSQLGDAQTDITGDSTFSAGTGISTLTVYSNTTGYYSCVINTDIIFLFYLADRNTLGELYHFKVYSCNSKKDEHKNGITDKFAYKCLRSMNK